MNANEPAFPTSFPIKDQGITIRAYIATKMDAALISCPKVVRFKDGGIPERMEWTSYAKAAVEMTDALIAELNKP